MNVPKLRFKDDDGSQFKEWESTTLGEIAEIKRGAASQHLKYVEDKLHGIRLIRINDFLKNEPVYVEETEDIKRFTLKCNDLLIAGTGATAGIVFRVPDEFDNLAYSYNAPRIRVNNANTGFVYYYLISDIILKQQKGLFVGNAQPFLDTDAIRGFKISLPELPEQTKVANFLTSIDDKIIQLTKKHNLLTQYKKGVMQQIFSQELRFKDDNGQDFPEWEPTKINEIADIIGGGTPDTAISDYWQGSIEWFTPTELKTKYVGKSLRTITEQGLKVSSAKLLPAGTLLLSSRATVGDVSIALNECTTNQGFQSLIVNEENDNEFVYYWLLNNKKALLEKASGSTFLEISKREIERLLVKRPSKAEQTKIAKFLTAVDNKITATQTQLEAVKQYKHGLIQQMFI